MLDIAPDDVPIADHELSPQDQRRAHILAAARACFSTAGFHGTSMQQVCAEAKMSPGALYRYFPSKDAIIEAIADDERGRAANLMQAFRGPGSLVDRIVGCGVAYLRMMHEEPSGRLMVEICAESLRNSAIGARFQCIEGDVRDKFIAGIVEAQATGEVGPEIDAELAVHVLLSVGDGLVMRMSLEESLTPERLEPFLRRMVGAILKLPT